MVPQVGERRLHRSPMCRRIIQGALLGSGGQQQAEGEAGRQCSLREGSADPVGWSLARIVFYHCSELGQRGWTFLYLHSLVSGCIQEGRDVTLGKAFYFLQRGLTAEGPFVSQSFVPAGDLDGAHSTHTHRGGGSL